ncbi:MAG: DUF3750 domain-containing protein [Pelagibacterales bacterium]|nr:DUF3750 domain-containing protein [Pelagibacterales bacterium]
MLIFLTILVFASLIYFNPKASNRTWNEASRESANLVELASDTPEAKIQIYSAKAYSWRGKFSQHLWIATKEKNAESYLVHYVVLWGTHFGSDGVMVMQEDLPDRNWYDAKPEIIFSQSGEKAEKIIPKIYQATKTYPYQKFYRAYPGPNSNTFISYIVRQIPEIKISLPNNAIGKDWLCDENGVKFFALSESKTGIQFSFFGMFGISLGVIEGIEINIIGISFGIDFLKPALKLPGIGRIGLKPKEQ